MSFEAIRLSVETKIATWSSVPISYDNVSFDSTAHDEWCRISLLDGESVVSGIGTTCEIRRTGLVEIQLFTKQWMGVKPARVYADELDVLFSNTRDGSMQYQTASINRIGHSDDVYQVNVTIPFIYGG